MEVAIIVGVLGTAGFLLFLWDHRKQPNQPQKH